MRTDELDFLLPPELIAQVPAASRAASRLLHYRRNDRSISHRAFADLPSLLRRGDLLVFNDARVIPARLWLRKSTGGLVEGLFLAEIESGRWRVLLKNTGPSPVGRVLRFESEPTSELRIVEQHEEGEFVVRLSEAEPALSVLNRVGRMPLPPYIKREKLRDERDAIDQERYQTVYAQKPGSVAAPTAGLHFTPDVLAALDAAQIERTTLTLHVGMGTFKPVTASTLQAHAMHTETYSMDTACAEALNRARTDHRRIIAVGTTSARVLESQPDNSPFVSRDGATNIFIYPPYQWKHVGALVTNFHLPRSTLIALVAAMVGLEAQRRIYTAAITESYRFFSYGDTSFLE